MCEKKYTYICKELDMQAAKCKCEKMFIENIKKNRGRERCFCACINLFAFTLACVYMYIYIRMHTYKCTV